MEETYCENCKKILKQNEELEQKIKDLSEKAKTLEVKAKELEESVLPE